MADKTQKETAVALERWRKDPLAFFTEVLDVKDEHVWDGMRKVAHSVRDYPRTCVYAGHGVSKSYTAPRIALWFLTCFGPKATVITTAPSHDQVVNILWRELRNAHSHAKLPLGGVLTRDRLDMGSALDENEEAKWFAYGFSTTPDTVTGEVTRMQGYHNDNMLVIFDEAAGIMPKVWKAADYLLTGDGNLKMLAIGNPTSPQGDFADCKDEPDWNCITLSVLDTPNYKKGYDVIPGLSGRNFVERMQRKWGVDSNEYKIRVLGELPSWGEGTFLGSLVADAKREGRVGPVAHEPTALVYTVWDIGNMHTAIWFVQFIQQRIHLIDFLYDCTGAGLPAYAKMVKGKPYNYGGHYAPHDIAGSNAKSFQTGKFTLDVARELGIGFNVIGKHAFDDRIGAMRAVMPKCWFDAEKCSEGLTALAQYRKRRNEALSLDDKPVYYNDPVKDWTCHPSDAFGYLAMAYKYEAIGSEILGATYPETDYDVDFSTGGGGVSAAEMLL